MNDLDRRLEAVAKSKRPWVEKFRVLNDFAVAPLLAELTEQTGTLHYSRVARYSSVEASNSSAIEVTRDRVKGQGLWNAVGRFFEMPQQVLYIFCPGQLWVCRYSVNQHYYLSAVRIRDYYVENLQEAFGSDFVIVQ